MQKKEAKTILSTQNGLNPYRNLSRGSLLDQGFDRGCMAETDYESVEAKINAPELLAYALRRKRNKCMIMAGSQSDPYQPCEEGLRIMRGCLEEIDRYGFGLALQTKSDLVLRDLDLLASINRKSRCIVQVSMMTVDEAVREKLEPNVCTAARRAEVLTELKKAGIPTIARIAPVFPFLNDARQNIEALMEACVGAGVYGLMGFEPGVTVREKDRETFLTRLEELFPEDPMLLKLSARVFREGGADPVILDYLCERFNGGEDEMYRLLKASTGSGCQTEDLEERLTGQMLSCRKGYTSVEASSMPRPSLVLPGMS